MALLPAIANVIIGSLTIDSCSAHPTLAPVMIALGLLMLCVAFAKFWFKLPRDQHVWDITSMLLSLASLLMFVGLIWQTVIVLGDIDRIVDDGGTDCNGALFIFSFFNVALAWLGVCLATITGFLVTMYRGCGGSSGSSGSSDDQLGVL